MNFVYLLLGSNLDDRVVFLQKAKEEISSTIGKISKESSVYESEPWGFLSENWFLNQVIVIATELKPLEILARIFKIEEKLGRRRTRKKGYAARLIDIDILFYNNEIISEETLSIPHPKIHKRMFTLLPLAELDSSMIHPVFGKSIGDLIKECHDNSIVNLYQPK